jgi:hypothetical protein
MNWTRDLFAQVRGYPHVGDGHDTLFEQLCQEHAPESVYVRPTTPENAYYSHREPSDSSDNPDILRQNEQCGQGVADSVYEYAALECFRQSQIQLKPH